MPHTRSRTALVVVEGVPARLAAVHADGFAPVVTPFATLKVLAHDLSAVATHGSEGVWVAVVGDPVGDRAVLAWMIATHFDPRQPGLGLQHRAEALMDGHWAAIIARPEGCWAITDHMGGLPLFHAEAEGATGAGIRRCLGTDLNAVAEVTGRLTADRVALHEFLRSGRVTFPYTAFQDVRRLEPGAITEWLRSDGAAEGRPRFVRYWEPRADTDLDADGAKEVMLEAARVMRTNIARLVDHYERVTLLFSGGSDSRVLAAMLQRSAAVASDPADIEAVMFLEQANLEHRRASRAARVLRIPLELRIRSADHYTRDVSELVSMCGVGFDVRHAHAHGLVSPARGGVFVDGWLADSLLKSLPRDQSLLVQGVDSTASGAELLAEGDVRRQARVAAVVEVRGDASDAAWANLWPLTAHADVVNRTGIQGIGAALSPFAFGSFVRAVAPIGEARKRSGDLFLEVFAREMGTARWLPASNGIIPSLPAPANERLRALTTARLEAVRRLRATVGLRTPAPGSWQTKSQAMSASAQALTAMEDGALALAEEITGYRMLPKLGKHHDQHLLQVAVAIQQGLIRS